MILLNVPNIHPKPIERKTKYPKIYSDYNKYSISRLITDLIEDNASILINPELIGEYKRLSPKKWIVILLLLTKKINGRK